MASNNSSWELWLKLIFILACCLVFIVGLALFANLWMNCRTRKQADRQKDLDGERGTVVIRPSMRVITEGKDDEEDEWRLKRGSSVEGIWDPEPKSDFDLPYSNSNHSASAMSAQTALLPPRPEMCESQPPTLSARSSCTELPYPPNQDQDDDLRQPTIPVLPDTPPAKSSSHHESSERPSPEDSSPASSKELGYFPASPSAFRRYLGLNKGKELSSGAGHSFFRPRSTKSGSPTRYSPAQGSRGASRLRVQTHLQVQPSQEHQPLTASSRYSHTLPSLSEASSPSDMNSFSILNAVPMRITNLNPNHDTNNSPDSPVVSHGESAQGSSSSVITTIAADPDVPRCFNVARAPDPWKVLPPVDLDAYTHDMGLRPPSVDQARSKPQVGQHVAFLGRDVDYVYEPYSRQIHETGQIPPQLHTGERGGAGHGRTWTEDEKKLAPRPLATGTREGLGYSRMGGTYESSRVNVPSMNGPRYLKGLSDTGATAMPAPAKLGIPKSDLGVVRDKYGHGPGLDSFASRRHLSDFGKVPSSALSVISDSTQTTQTARQPRKLQKKRGRSEGQLKVPWVSW